MYEAARYVDGWDLPCVFIIEDNDRSVDANKAERWGNWKPVDFNCVKRYSYTSTWPHGGTGSGKWIEFKKQAVLDIRDIADQAYDLSRGVPSTELSYKHAVRHYMNKLAAVKGAIFVGYNVRHSSAYETLADVPLEQRLETPLAENLMAGLAMGMSLEGFYPVLYFERHDFVFNALDALINQLDKIEMLSQGQFRMPVIIRAVAGGIKPFYAGVTHTSDYTGIFKQLFSFPVFAPSMPGEVLQAYDIAMGLNGDIFRHNTPLLICEQKSLY